MMRILAQFGLKCIGMRPDHPFGKFHYDSQVKSSKF